MFAREITSNDCRGLTDNIFKIEEMNLKHSILFTKSFQNQELR